MSQSLSRTYPPGVVESRAEEFRAHALRLLQVTDPLTLYRIVYECMTSILLKVSVSLIIT